MTNFTQLGWDKVRSNLTSNRRPDELQLMHAIYICACTETLEQFASRLMERHSEWSAIRLVLADVIQQMNVEVDSAAVLLKIQHGRLSQSYNSTKEQ